MIYYECYHINKSYNFNMKLNYIFNDMEHQALVTFVVIRVTMIAPINEFHFELMFVNFHNPMLELPCPFYL
jgi:hypothetical protein